MWRFIPTVVLSVVLACPAAAAGHRPPDSSRSVASSRLAVAHVAKRVHRGRAATLIRHGDRRSSLPGEPLAAAARRSSLRAVTAANAVAGLPETWCGTPTMRDDTAHATYGTLPSIKLVYAYAADRPNRFAEFANAIQADVSLLGRLVAEESGMTKTIRFDLGTDCGPAYADVRVLALPRPAASYADGSGAPSFSALAADARAVLADEKGTGIRNYMIYADGLRGNSGVLGTAESYIGPAAEAPGSENIHNLGALYGVVWGRASVPAATTVDPYLEPTGMLHELVHTLGAVQLSAPHTSGAGHCSDEWDVLCYEDGGASDALSFPCPQVERPVPEVLDCGRDDYFAADPPTGTYLATHWNVYRSIFLGACPDLAAICGVSPPPPPAPAPPPPVSAPPDEPARRSASGWLRRVKGTRSTGRLARVRLTRGTSAGRLAVAVSAGRMTLPPGAWRVRVCASVGASAAASSERCRRRTVRLARRARVRVPRVRLTVGAASASQSGAVAIGTVKVMALRGRVAKVYAVSGGPDGKPLSISLR